MTHEEVFKKIKALLNLGKHENGNEHEMMLALQKAQELALKNGLSLEEIENGGESVSREVIEQVVPQDTVTIASTKSSMARIVADNFRVEVFTENYSAGVAQGRRIIMVGFPEDVEIAQSVLNFVWVSYEQLFKSYLKRLKREAPQVAKTRSDSIRIKNDYYLGFIQGLKKAFEENVQSKALVLVKDKAISTYIETSRGKLHKGRPVYVQTQGCSDAQSKGYDDGLYAGKMRGKNALPEES